MPENALIWLALLTGGITVGASLVGLLVVRRSLEPVMALCGFAAMMVTAVCFGRMIALYDRVDALAYAFIFSVAGAGGGYALASSLLDRLRRDVALPSLPDSPVGHGTAVIVLSCAEPSAYDPEVTAGQLGKLHDEDLFTPSLGVMPFMFAAAKARYRAIGGRSDSREVLSRVTEALDSVLPPEFAEKVVPAACDGDDQFAACVADAVASGCSRIIVSELAVAESLGMAAAKRSVDAMRPEEHGVEVVYAEPLWDSARLAALVVRRIVGLVADPATTGVVLLGHGQPEGRSHLDPLFDERETTFLNRVRAGVAENGVPEQHIRVAWAEWRQPDTTDVVRHLTALGCSRIVVSPACFPLENMTTRLDVPMAIRQARVADTVTTVTVKAWSDDPVVIEELRAAVAAVAQQ